MKNKKVIGVIPARYASTRLPGKPLVLIKGKPMLQWVIEGAKSSKLLSKVLVATDDERVLELAKNCDVEAIMTSSEIPTGTDRVFQSLKGMDYDIALNIQGDEPLLNGGILDHLISMMLESPQTQMGTLAHSFKSLQDLENPNNVKVLLNQNNEAIYFSRFPIPYSRIKAPQDLKELICFQHIGLYAYRKDFLKEFCNTPPQKLEGLESLEQLRALFLDTKIKVGLVDYLSKGVDTPEDVSFVEGLLD